MVEQSRTDNARETAATQDRLGGGPWNEAWRRLRRNRMAMFGLGVVACLVLLGLLAGLLAPYDPYTIDLQNRLQPPSRHHLFGTDDFGRDIFSRTLYGARISLEVGILSRSVALSLGILLGVLAGYFGGKLDQVIMRLTDVMFAFPALLFLIGITAALKPGLTTLFIAIGLVGWAPMARLMRAQVLATKENDYVTAARAIGLGTGRIIRRHLFPNCLAPVIISFSMGMAAAIMAEASLSFIGLGAQPPTPSWGSMISLGRDYLRTAPWLTVYPGIAIGLTVLGFNLLGDGLRDALDPKMKV
jgi:ABC-type dipeptide/oligopeptide/nickel transport system permease subunit